MDDCVLGIRILVLSQRSSRLRCKTQYFGLVIYLRITVLWRGRGFLFSIHLNSVQFNVISLLFRMGISRDVIYEKIYWWPTFPTPSSRLLRGPDQKNSILLCGSCEREVDGTRVEVDDWGRPFNYIIYKTEENGRQLAPHLRIAQGRQVSCTEHKWDPHLRTAESQMERGR